MKRYTFILFLLLLSQGMQAQEATLADSKIEEVTVYLQGAQVTRSATVNLLKGDNVVRFAGLAEGINPSSIQATAPGSVLLNSVSHEVNFLEPLNYSPRVKQIKDSLQLVDRRMEDLDDDIAAVVAEKSMILLNQSLASKEQGLSTAKLEALANFFRKRIGELNVQATEKQRSKTELQQTRNRLNRQLGELNANRQQPSNDIVVKLRAERPVRAEIAIRYLVDGARWVPAYDLRVSDTQGPIALTYRADVSQSTGIDWTDVKLSLSSADPSQSGVKPVLSQWNLYLAQPVFNRGRGDYYKDEGYPAGGRLNDAYGGAPETEGLYQTTLADYTNVVEGATTAEFRIDIRQRIPSDGKAHQVSIQDAKLPATYLHSAVPKLDPTAYLLARITDWEKLNLLPGSVNIFFEGTYVAESYIDPNYTQDTLAFSLGRDPKVVVQREQLQNFSKVRSLGANRERTFGFETTVRNTKATPIEIELYDQVPVSQDEEITVKVEELSGGKQDEATGRITWKLKLAPGETQKFRLVFSVKHPKKKTVPGI